VSLNKWKHEPNHLAGRATQLLLDPAVSQSVSNTTQSAADEMQQENTCSRNVVTQAAKPLTEQWTAYPY